MLKAQEANLTGLGHCIYPTVLVADPEPKSVIMQVTNELPMDDIEPIAVNAESNSLPIATLFVPSAEEVHRTTTPNLLGIGIISTETPILTLQPDTLQFVSLENITDEVRIVDQLPVVQSGENESMVLRETLSFGNKTSFAATIEDTTGIPESNELVTEPIHSVSYLPESALNWTNVVQPLPVEPPPPEPILAEDII